MKLKSMNQIVKRLILSFMLIIIGVTLLFTVIRVVKERTAAITQAHIQISGNAEAISSKIEDRLRNQIRMATLIGSEMATSKKHDITSRTRVDDLLKNYLAIDSGFYGTYAVWEANEWDGADSLFRNIVPSDSTGRLLTYWHRSDNGIISEAVVGYNANDASADWYKLPIRENRAALIDPFLYQVTGGFELMVSGVVPTLYNGKIVGISGIDMAMEFVQSELLKVQKTLYGGTAELVLLSSNRTVAGATVNDSLVGQPAPKELLPSAEIESALEKDQFTVQNAGGNMIIWHTITLPTTDKPWILSISVPNSVILAHANEVTRNSILFGLLLAVASLIYGILKTRSMTLRIVEPVSACVKAAHDVAEGKTAVTITDASIDELHELVLSFRTMTEALEKKASVVEEIASGNLLVQPETLSDNDRLGISLVHMVQQLRETLHRIDIASISVETGSGHLAQASNALSDGASSQAASIEEIHSSLTEITASAQSGASEASDAAKIANKSEEIAREGASHMEALSGAMREIEKASSAIAKIIKTIEDIAFQTNLLALNAAVEAARAGQHGKGFAVVADEVRTLANRSAKAAAETSDLIQITSAKVATGVQVAKDTEVAFSSIRDSVADVAKRISSIAEVVSSQAKGVQEIGIGLDVINQVTQSNTAHAEESASTSAELAMQSVELRSLVGRFQFVEHEPTIPEQKQLSRTVQPRVQNRPNQGISWKS